MSAEEKINRIYDVVLRMEETVPSLVGKLECSEHRNLIYRRADAADWRVTKMHIIVGAVSGTLSAIVSAASVIIGFYLKAKGIL